MTNAEPKGQLKYRFDQFTLDPGRGTVLNGDRVVKLRPKVYDALLYILENRGRLIGKEELIRALWSDAFVTEDSLVQCMVELRRALDDRAQEIVKTVPRRGYVFTAAVTTSSFSKSRAVPLQLTSSGNMARQVITILPLSSAANPPMPQGVWLHY